VIAARSAWLATVAAFLVFAMPAAGFKHVRQPVTIPMRDGQLLAADVYLPALAGRWPVVLVQTPYDKRQFVLVFTTELSDDALLKSPDFAFVVTDWRGFYGSADAAVAGYDRGLDGYDTVEWIAVQPWCDGNVGTWGASALGVVQFQTAAKRPPHLRGAVPMVSHMRDVYELYYPGGVYARNKNTFVGDHFGGDDVLRAHPLEDSAWAAIESGGVRAEQIAIPMLHISGWYDHEADLSLVVAADVQAHGGESARGRQKVLVGPWSHGGIGKEEQGELSYPAAAGESSRLAAQFFDRYLRGIENGWEGRATFRIFAINTEAWRDADTWPPGDTSLRRYYLTAEGGLTPASPTQATAERTYTSDPANPVPTLFGAILVQDHATQGPGDIAAIETRPDVLTFTTPILAEPLRIEGTVTAMLWVGCDAVDTDLAVRMTQVLPDGRSLLLVDGIRRASLRDSFGSRALLDPSTPVAVSVTLPSVAVILPVGYRLRFDIASSNYDRFDVNMQDGSSLSDQPGVRATPANVRILLSADHPSTVELPVVVERRARRHLAVAH
jgi:predicted acyl esterase